MLLMEGKGNSVELKGYGNLQTEQTDRQTDKREAKQIR